MTEFCFSLLHQRPRAYLLPLYTADFSGEFKCGWKTPHFTIAHRGRAETISRAAEVP
jgi:hypothetical protein